MLPSPDDDGVFVLICGTDGFVGDMVLARRWKAGRRGDVAGFRCKAVAATSRRIANRIVVAATVSSTQAGPIERVYDDAGKKSKVQGPTLGVLGRLGFGPHQVFKL